MAVIKSSDAPLLLLNENLSVLAASRSFSQAFDLDPKRVVSRPLGALGVGEWNGAQLRVLLEATAAGAAEIEAYEMDLKRGPSNVRKLLVNAHKLEYPGVDSSLLLVSISDVTDARKHDRERDDLLREKGILLQEIQHRVANSLQIIASVLMQSARKVQSEETRSHLTDAHRRVMSIATLQKQLAVSSLGSVELGPYLTSLCDSIGASMIHDQNQISLVVEVAPTSVSADQSVSLGLTVTELVINALKHAFPDHRQGVITVGYASTGEAWTLSVCDDGVGMPTDVESAKPGLGTSIVEALSNQLECRVEVSDEQPGTRVSIIHEPA